MRHPIDHTLDTAMRAKSLVFKAQDDCDEIEDTPLRKELAGHLLRARNELEALDRAVSKYRIRQAEARRGRA